MYLISIQKLTPVEGKNYPDSEEIYKQRVEKLDLDKLIIFINQQKPEDKELQIKSPVQVNN